MLQLRRPSYQRSPGVNEQPSPILEVNNMNGNLNNNNNTNTNNPINSNNSNINQPLNAQTINLMTNIHQLQSQIDETLNNPKGLQWINKKWADRIISISAFFSFISICANTPETFKLHESVKYFTYFTDLTCTIVFILEMIIKMKIRGLIRSENPYLFDRWCQFDGIMVVFHIISVILQVKTKLKNV